MKRDPRASKRNDLDAEQLFSIQTLARRRGSYFYHLSWHILRELLSSATPIREIINTLFTVESLPRMQDGKWQAE